MTREQAIQGWIIPAIKNTWSEKHCQEIIKALEQEQCEDAISRQAALEAMMELPHEHRTAEQRARTNGIVTCRGIVDALPSIQPQQKVGRWIPYKIENEKKVVLNDDLSKEETLQQQDWEERYEPCYICSCCGKADFYSNYCPDCGAKMAESEDKE